MRLSRKDEHSITALLVLANQNRTQTPINLAELAAALEISTSYLEHLFCGLRKAGLIEGLRGVGGGYRLARPPSQISLADILYATEALSSDIDKIPETNLELPTVLASEAWLAVSRKLRDVFDEITLADFLLTKVDKLGKCREHSVSSYIATMFRPHSSSSGLSV